MPDGYGDLEAHLPAPLDIPEPAPLMRSRRRLAVSPEAGTGAPHLLGPGMATRAREDHSGSAVTGALSKMDGDAEAVVDLGQTLLRHREKVRVVRGVRSRRLVRRVDVWTVCKVSMMFYLLVLVMILIAGVGMWHAARAFGVIHSIEKSVRTLFSLKSFTIHPMPTLEYAAAAGVVMVVFGTLVNVIGALIYNLIADVVGGVQVVVVSAERE